MIKKPTWIYETGVFPTEEQPNADELFVAALRKQGLEVLEFDKNSMLQKEFTSELREAKFGRVPVYRGSLRKCRALGVDQKVGIDEWSNYNCSTWLTHFGEFALNSKYLILSIAELWRRRAEILDYFESSGELFIRPDSGLKQFHGGVSNLVDYQTLEHFCNYLRQSKEFKVLVAPRQTIGGEYRFFCRGSEVITGSTYQINGRTIMFPPHHMFSAHHENGSIISSEVQGILKTVSWVPSPLWSIDIAVTGSKLSVIEVGSYHCAGVYASDLDKYIEAANNFATRASQED